jgi:hypothetical protein
MSTGKVALKQSRRGVETSKAEDIIAEVRRRPQPSGTKLGDPSE